MALLILAYNNYFFWTLIASAYVLHSYINKSHRILGDILSSRLKILLLISYACTDILVDGLVCNDKVDTSVRLMLERDY